MCDAEKIQLLNELAEPFGFCYVPCEDVFTSREDAWQRKQGYEALYDRAAVGAGMVFDALPIYFDYAGETWLIEFWKGQYGINTGGEVGVYHAGKVVPERYYRIAHFEAVEDQDMPFIQCRLDRRRKKVYFLQKRHWWLTGFGMGTFSRPSDLILVTTIRFQNECMAEAFFEGLKRAKGKIPGNKYRICRNEVYVRMDFCMKHKFCASVWRCMVQAWNCFCCFLYRLFTHPFIAAPDRLLFLLLSASVVFETCVSDAGMEAWKIRKDIRPFPVRCGSIKRFQKQSIFRLTVAAVISSSATATGEREGQMIIS